MLKVKKIKKKMNKNIMSTILSISLAILRTFFDYIAHIESYLFMVIDCWDEYKIYIIKYKPADWKNIICTCVFMKYIFQEVHICDILILGKPW